MTEANSTASTSAPKAKIIPSFVLAGGILALSSTAIFIKIASRELSAEAVVFDRLFFSTLFFTSWHWGRPLLGIGKNAQPSTEDDGISSLGALFQSPDAEQDAESTARAEKRRLIIALLLGMAVAQLAARLVWTWSLEYTTAANGTMLANMPPLFTALGGWLFLGQRFDRRFLSGVGIAMMGAVVLAMGDWLYPQEELFGTMGIIGDLAALMSSAFYAAGYLVIEKLRQYLSTTDILVWRCVLGLAMVAPFVLWFDDVLFPVSLVGWFAIFGLSFISEVIGHGSVVYVLKHFSSAFITTAFLLEPLPVATYGWFVLGEFLSTSSIIGFILISIGIYFAKTGQGSESQVSAENPTTDTTAEKSLSSEPS